MQITLQKNETGNLCLFDTRSGQFMKGCCVKSEESPLLGLANTVAKKSFKTILEMADNYVYTDEGYVEAMISAELVRLNPWIREKVLERLSKKEDRKTITKRKPRMEKEPKVKKETVAKVPKEPKAKVVIGLNEDGTPVHRGRGRPRSLTPKPEKVVVLDANGNARGRGRPRKNAS